MDQGGVVPGELAIISEETVCPYERPALTKAYLHPPSAKVRARLPGFHTCVGGGGDRQDDQWYKTKGIQVFTDVKVVQIDCGKKEVFTHAGQKLTYDTLMFATGARPVTLQSIGVSGKSTSVKLSTT